MLRKVLVTAALGPLLLAGCSSRPERLAVVSGRVTLAGAPVPGGLLVVKSLDPGAQVQTTNCLINPDGTYKLTEAPVGPIALAVDTDYLLRDILPMMGVKPDAPPDPTYKSLRYVKLPKKYADVKTSGLEFEVKPGQQEFDIVLGP